MSGSGIESIWYLFCKTYLTRVMVILTDSLSSILGDNSGKDAKWNLHKDPK